MNGLILIIYSFTTLCGVTTALGRLSLIAQLSFMASRSQYAAQVQESISMENIMADSMNTAIHACQISFKWDRWNCPSSDFFARSSSNSLFLDHEDAYVKAIFTASVLYTITKNCSSGKILATGCNTCSDNSHSADCSDKPKVAAKLFRQHFTPDFQDNLNGKVAQHNYEAVTNLLIKSLKKQCICSFLGPNGDCLKEVCIQILKPFEEIAADVRKMYDEGLQLDNYAENAHIIWHNIPMDVLLYVKDSPDYCEANALLQWNGMRGRHCTASTNGKNLTQEERKHCRHLCHDCGHTVVKRNVATERRCNCKLTWEFQIQCEICVTVQRQYYCY